MSRHQQPLGFVRTTVMRDAWEGYVSDDLRRETPVTVGIGVLCDANYEEGKCIILAVDNKATYGIPPLTTNNACGKFQDLLPVLPVVLAISGDIATCDAVVASFYDHMKKFKEEQDKKGEPIGPDHLRVGIRKAREYEYEMFLREEMQAYLGMSLQRWREDKHPEIRRKGWAVVRAARLYFPVWIIAGGFWGNHFGLMKSSGACITEMGAGHFAVGLGDVVALKQLHRRRQEPYMSAPRTLLHIAEAMECARKYEPKYIGKPADYSVLMPSRDIKRFPASSPVLAEWIRDFKKKDSAKMQSDRYFRNQFMNSLLDHNAVNPY